MEFSQAAQNQREVDGYLYKAGETAGATEEGLWRAAFVNVGGAIAYALIDVADALRDAAERANAKSSND